MKNVLKTLTVCIFMSLACIPDMAYAANLKTIVKWVCSREGLVRTVRLTAIEAGKAPCKVFYAKRDVVNDPNDAQVEAKEDRGEIKPIYFATHNGEFCPRKMQEFLSLRAANGWSCSKI